MRARVSFLKYSYKLVSCDSIESLVSLVLTRSFSRGQSARSVAELSAIGFSLELLHSRIP